MMETELHCRMEESACRHQTPLSSKASAFSIEALMGQKSSSSRRELRGNQCCRDDDDDDEEDECSQMDEDGCYSPAAAAAVDASPLATSFDATDPEIVKSLLQTNEIDDQEEEEEEEDDVNTSSRSSRDLGLLHSLSLLSRRPGLHATKCCLESNELWRRFNELGTEMIITKSGRRMFPALRVSFTALQPDESYSVALDIVSVDRKRYRYAYHRSSWVVAGKADPPKSSRLYFHPDSTFSGDQLVKQTVTFERLKLTNNPIDRPGHIVLNSMHRYQPRVHLIRTSPSDHNLTSIDLLNPEDYKTFVFPETTFTAVTAYQNQLITRLKIDSNPFAKGFRDSVRLTEMERKDGGVILRDLPSSSSKPGSLFLTAIPSKYGQRFEHQHVHTKSRCPSSGQAKHLEQVSLGIRKVNTKTDQIHSFGNELDENLDKMVDASSVRPFLLNLSSYNHPSSSYALFGQQFIHSAADGAHSYMAKHLLGLQKMLSAFPSYHAGSVQTPTEVASNDTSGLGLYGILDSSFKPETEELRDSIERNRSFSKTTEN